LLRDERAHNRDRHHIAQRNDRGRPPCFGHHPACTYLAAVEAVGTTDADKVMEELHKAKIDDMFTDDGVIRADGVIGCAARAPAQCGRSLLDVS
jgi:hypothetical protein